MTAGTASAPWGRVLVVDDDADVQVLIAAALGQFGGYTVEACRSSMEAVPRARAFAPHVILLDVMMPGADGPETLRLLRSDAATAHIPVIFISASVDEHHGGQYRDLGALGAIAKPFDPAVLPATLERIRTGMAGRETAAPALHDLRPLYATELAGKLRSMEAVARTLTAEGWSRPGVEELFVLAHRMAGSAGLFGFHAVAAAAGVLASMLRRRLDDAGWPPARSPAEVMTLVRAVAAAARRGPRTVQERRTGPDTHRP